MIDYLPRIGRLFGWALLAMIAVAVITVPLDAKSQWQFAGATIVGALIINRWKSQKGALAIGLLSLIVSTRYLFWRTTQTLSFGGPLEAMLGTGLYLAEAYAWVILVLGFIQTSWPLYRPVVEPAGDPSQWPTVDVYIPTYNESLSIVRNTVYAAMDMDYPADRFNVYILDDGKRPEFKAFARKAGCGYITRDNNLHAKAGNMNAAMKKTDGKLIAIFDCDHVPTRSFLQLSVGWFDKDPKLALMQTPHHMYSPDPVQRNLGNVVGDMPGEGDLFYGPVQGGNDLWNAAFFCGSCAIIRREALEITNGFAGETVTEDAHTALKLQRMGWNTGYLEARLSAGLATERFVLHVGQRIRWARGMTQILRIDCPLFGRGLSITQRLCYLNAMMHFQFPLPRIVFLTSPLAYLIFGQNIIQASASLIFAFSAPHLVCSQVFSGRSQLGWRRPFWGEVYETMLAFHLVKPTVMTWFQPRKGKFNVTDKGDLLDQTFFDWAIVKPHLVAIALLAGAVSMGWIKLLFFQSSFNIQIDTLLLNTAWASFSLIILLAAVSVARETRQARKDIRIHAELPVTLYLKSGHAITGVTRDISMGGAAIALPADLPVREPELTHIALDMDADRLVIPVDTIRTARGYAFVRFHPLDMAMGRKLVRAVMGRADAWQMSAPDPVGELRSVKDILAVDLMTLKRLLGLNVEERRRMRAQRAQMAAANAELPSKPVPAAKEAAKDKPMARPEASSEPVEAEAALAERPMLMARPVAAPKGLAGVQAAACLLAVMVASMLAPHDALRAQAPVAAAATAAPEAAAPAAPLISAGTTGTRREHLTFKDLRIKTPIRLAGTRGEIGIPFGMRPNDIVTDALVTLRAAWSPALLGDLSQLVVLLNGEVVQTVALTRDNAGGITLKIPVNPALFLPGDNQLNLRLIAHYARDCEDPFHSSLWANVSNVQSGFDLTVQSLPKAPDLASLPGPFFDRHDNGALHLPFVFAAAPTHGDLEAAASISSWMGSLASYRGFAFKPMVGRLPTGNAIVFMKAPALGINVPINGATATMIRNPADSSGMLLVIAGRNDAEIRLAAAALASAKGIPGGAQMSFDNARIPTWPRYGAPRWLTTGREVKLGEVMAPYALVGMGLPPGPLAARFRLAPDLFFWPRQGGSLNLGYIYPDAKWLDREGSRMDVSINGQFLKTLPLTGMSWWQRLWYGSGANSVNGRGSVGLPRYNLFGSNEIVFDYNLIMADKQKCTGTLPDNVRVGLDPNSTINLTGAWHGLQMPDLASFAGAGYPFTVRPDLSETVVVMDEHPSEPAIEAFLDMMGRLGDSTGVATTGVTVSMGGNGEQTADHDVLVIGSANLAGGALFANAPLRNEGGTLKVTERSPLQYVESLLGGWGKDNKEDVENTVYASKGFNGIVAFESPISSGRSVVALIADDTATLPQLVDGMNDDKINAQIQGDLAVTTGDGMNSFAIGPRYWAGSLPLWMKMAYWFSQRPLLMALSGVLLALLLTGPVYLIFARQAKKRLQGEAPADLNQHKGDKK
ncbi:MULTISPECIES: UDP-forming cellulose synthase catalytic subunit [unclassified Novosphingobium]|uniref:UDP-forming cellulose synthase catalytic subunit n=1 Tax=unclassified Novosphingobium TaxID=2644732 RepID=UPI000A46DAF0|nr:MULTISPECIES: UDP-forming cellulose synthase catalytic subunit [unclassified Novosphingobium]MDR6706139.1 cellulose synthase (UDP-forming) [Novosphingobium sp. 1748]